MQVSTGLPPPLMSWAGTAVAGSPRQHEQERLQRSSHRCLSQLDAVSPGAASHPVASLPALNSSTPLSKQKSRILPMLILQRYNLPHAKRPSGAIFNCRVWILTTLWRSGVCTEAGGGQRALWLHRQRQLTAAAAAWPEECDHPAHSAGQKRPPGANTIHNAPSRH